MPPVNQQGSSAALLFSTCVICVEFFSIATVGSLADARIAAASLLPGKTAAPLISSHEP